MSLNEMSAASLACSREVLEAINCQFDVFSSGADSSVVILDTTGWDESEMPLKTLSGLVGVPASELSDQLLVLYL